jgi:hypothetical protein
MPSSQTILEMLKDRGYLVKKDEENATKEEIFDDKGISEDDMEIQRDKFTILKRFFFFFIF